MIQILKQLIQYKYDQGSERGLHRLLGVPREGEAKLASHPKPPPVPGTQNRQITLNSDCLRVKDTKAFGLLMPYQDYKLARLVPSKHLRHKWDSLSAGLTDNAERNQHSVCLEMPPRLGMYLKSRNWESCFLYPL